MYTNFPALQGGGIGGAASAGLSQGIQNATHLIQGEGAVQHQAIQAEQARIASEKYAQEMKPIRVKELRAKTTPDMWDPMEKVMDMQGIIQKDSDEPYIRAGDLQKFQEDFKKNPIQQAMVLTASKQKIAQDKAPHLKTYEECKKNDAAWNDHWKREYEDTFEDVKDKAGNATGKKVQNMEAFGKLKERMAKDKGYIKNTTDMKTAQDAMLKYEKEEDTRLTALNIINDTYKKHKEKYGQEMALNIANGRATVFEAENILQQQKAATIVAAYRAKQKTPEEQKESADIRNKSRADYAKPDKPDKLRKDETPEGQIDKKIKGLESHIKINYDTKIKENEKKLKELEKVWKEDAKQSSSDQRISKEEYTRDKGTLEWNIKSNQEEKQKTVEYINQLRAGGAAPAEQTYPKGAIVPGKDGNYRFKGGNWKDKKNWVKVP